MSGKMFRLRAPGRLDDWRQFYDVKGRKNKQTLAPERSTHAKDHD
jgi:hypothetical protein